jgi:hypothetical protein
MSWYSNDREESSRKEQEILDKLSGDRVFRFRIKPGENCSITFLDDPKPTFYFAEHSVKNGNHFEFVTCVGEESHCPLCAEGEVPSFALAGTVINHGEYKTKKGNTIRNRKQLIVLKGKAKRAFEKQIDKRKGDVAYAVFEADRDISPTSCGTGESFEFKGKLTKEKILKFVPEGTNPDEFLKPFNYEEILAPKAYKGSQESKSTQNTTIGSTPEEDPLADLLEKDDEFEEVKDLEGLL